MKNIILIDRDLNFIDEFLARGYHIVVLIVDTDLAAQSCKEKYKNHSQIAHILSLQALQYVDGTPYFNNTLLECYKEAQYKVEFVAHRWLNDGMLSSNKFYNALFWWNHIFDHFRIDFVFIPEIEHGAVYDIPAYIAKHRDIPAFFAPPTLIYGISLLYFNTETYVPLVSGHLNKTQIQENLFYSFNPDDIILPTSHTSLWKKQKSLIRNILLKIGGQILIDFITCLRNKSFFISQHHGNFPVSFWHRFSSLLYTKKMKRFYAKHAIKPDYEEKFIFYAMHFEPEGGTSVCVPLQNQLTIIQMLHQALPKGWKLYVKEHPHQFMLNNPEMIYFLYNLKWWKSIEFYKELQKLEHLRLITFDTSSKELINYAKALATINGTIHLEATFLNKPCIVFAPNILLKNCKNIIYAKNYKQLKEKLELLAKNPELFSNGLDTEIFNSNKTLNNTAEKYNFYSFINYKSTDDKLPPPPEILSHYVTHYRSKNKAKNLILSLETYLQGWRHEKHPPTKKDRIEKEKYQSDTTNKNKNIHLSFKQPNNSTKDDNGGNIW